MAHPHLPDDEAEAEARIDRFHNGYFAHQRGEPRPTDADAAAGWDERARDALVRVVMPARPEAALKTAQSRRD